MLAEGDTARPCNPAAGFQLKQRSRRNSGQIAGGCQWARAKTIVQSTTARWCCGCARRIATRAFALRQPAIARHALSTRHSQAGSCGWRGGHSATWRRLFALLRAIVARITHLLEGIVETATSGQATRNRLIRIGQFNGGNEIVTTGRWCFTEYRFFGYVKVLVLANAVQTQPGQTHSYTVKTGFSSTALIFCQASRRLRRYRCHSRVRIDAQYIVEDIVFSYFENVRCLH